MTFVEKVARAIRTTERLNTIPYDDQESIRKTWSDLTGREVDETFRLIPPVYCDHGINITLGRNVFVNQGCRFNDIGGIEIDDDVMLGPNVSLISAGHSTSPADRRRGITAAPIRIGRNVWIGTGAIVLQGVTIGADAIVGAGAVVTRSVPPATLVVGSPARVVRKL
ncbi:sugar O-acetyltransferase [Kribbella sp. NPDC000426]|uniref:sugar O-acetyltransferase n=1 Tax=Kribbella sp. NPDC000426 TaxID=3154255 RepID=UPI003330F47B